MIEGTWGFVTWQDVTSDVVEGQKATFYFMPTQPMRGWAGNAQRIEVKSFRAGRVTSPRDKSARIYVEYVPRGARKVRTGVERSRPSLVIVEGWDHPLPPDGWISDGSGSRAAKWHLFAPEWRLEMDAFLAEYLRDHPSVHMLVDFRDGTNRKSPGRPSQTEDRELPSPDSGDRLPDTSGNSSGRAETSNTYPPDEVHLNEVFTEGAVEAIVLNVYERNAAARRRCIEHYGSECFVCGFDFARMYGSAVRSYIHVHHIRALSEIRAEYVVDPIADLRPVCPNCHAVIHSRKPQCRIDEVQTMVSEARSSR